MENQENPDQSHGDNMELRVKLIRNGYQSIMLIDPKFSSKQAYEDFARKKDEFKSRGILFEVIILPDGASELLAKME